MGRGGTRRSSGRAGAPTRRGGARWLAVWALAAVVIALGGCRASGARGGEESARGARVIYESEGAVCAVKPFGADGRDQVLVWEWFSPEVLSVDERYGHLIPGDGGMLRVVHLDLARGKARAKGQWPSHSPAEMLPLSLAVSRDGRRTAMAGGDREDPLSLAGSVFVLDERWRWVPVVRFEERSCFGLEWSPDGRALAYISIDAEHIERGALAVDAVALPVPRPAGPAQETMLTAEETGSLEVAWAADGQAIYQVVQDASGFSLEAVAWPSLERRTVKRADALLLRLSVARSSGDVVFLEKVTGEPKPEGEGPSEGESEFVLWRMPPGGEADGTGVRLSSAPWAAAVSPDGKQLLVIPRAETEQRFPMHGNGLALHSLADRGSRSFRELEGKEVASADWVLGGRAVLAAEGQKRVWLLAGNGRVPEVGPFSLEAPAAPEADESAKRLTDLWDAVATYTAYHDDLFPNLRDMHAVREALGEYVDSEEVFLDPRTGEPYGINSAFSGQPLVDVEAFWDPGVEAVLFFEEIPREDGGRYVAMIDGSVLYVSAKRWEDLKPNSGEE